MALGQPWTVNLISRRGDWPKPSIVRRSKRQTLAVRTYVLGIVAAHEASELWGPERKNYFLLAARYLALARKSGFSQATGPIGTVLLGESLYYAGRRKSCRPVLEEAIELSPPDATMLHRLLADAYRRKPQRDLKQALQHNRQYLEDGELSQTDRHTGQLQQANLLWQLKDYAACQKMIDSIPTDAFVRAEVDLLRGRLAMREARQLKKQFGPEATPAQHEQVADSDIKMQSRFCARPKTIRWA